MRARTTFIVSSSASTSPACLPSPNRSFMKVSFRGAQRAICLSRFSPRDEVRCQDSGGVHRTPQTGESAFPDDHHSREWANSMLLTYTKPGSPHAPSRQTHKPGDHGGGVPVALDRACL